MRPCESQSGAGDRGALDKICVQRQRVLYVECTRPATSITATPQYTAFASPRLASSEQKAINNQCPATQAQEIEKGGKMSDESSRKNVKRKAHYDHLEQSVDAEAAKRFREPTYSADPSICETGI